MAPQHEEDFPAGHPGRHDFDPRSREAAEWARLHVAPLGERDFPVDHPKAADTPGHTNALEWRPGVDPHNPHREAHTGRTPAQADGVKRLSELASKAAADSPVSQPVDAAAVNAALDRARADLGRDQLTPDEYAGVLAQFHEAAAGGAAPREVKAAIARQHQALDYLMGKGWNREDALRHIERDGAEQILAAAEAAAQ